MLAALALTLALTPGLVAGDYCQDRGTKRVQWTEDAKARTQERIDAGLADLGVSRAVAAFHRMVVCRESFCGESSVRHMLGKDSDGTDEDGLGAYGLSLRWQAAKWGGDAEPAFCTVGVSLLRVQSRCNPAL